MEVRRLCLALLALATASRADKDNIVQLTKFNFEDNVRNGAWFVKFYVPWCTHCQKLAPIWEKLADQAIQNQWPVKIAEVDCMSSKDVCERVNAKAFPTLALIADGSLKGKYQGEGSVPRFEEWLTEQLNLEGSGSTKASGASVLSSKPKAKVEHTASHFSALLAVGSNLLAWFPTKSKIANVYIMGVISLGMLVVGLMVLFKQFEADDSGSDDEKKRN
mmetsp:Transcript_29781/g.68584  ORF Transcript_29781/g.68584 Transcript_29781/m.68584 type:complete len:219 (-) Transcript_29781:99-755(-)